MWLNLGAVASWSHCSAELARIIFQVAQTNKRFLTGYAWFVTEDVMHGLRPTSGTSDQLADYPVGLLAVTACRRQLRPITLMRNSVRLIGRGLRRYQRKTSAVSAVRRPASAGSPVPFNSGSDCWSDGRLPYFADGKLLYR